MKLKKMKTRKKIKIQFDIITIFPEIFSSKGGSVSGGASYLSASILGRAVKKKIISVKTHNLRNFADDKRGTVDNLPYGGGAGMVLMAEPLLKAILKVRKEGKVSPQKTKLVLFSAKGKTFNQKMAQNWAKKYERIIFVSGRYEGIDERVKLISKAEEISVGPYVLTDGDVAAMTVISAVSRLIPGVINFKSLEEESHFNLTLKKEGEDAVREDGLEYPHYTRPEIILWKGKKWRVPSVLLSGNHKRIKEWRNGS